MRPSEAAQALRDIDLQAALVEGADESAPLIRSNFTNITPWRTGDLSNSISYRRSSLGGGVSMIFQTPVSYAQDVVKGTRAHTIHPVAARALHWGGSPGFFAMSANIPAHGPNNFPQRVADASLPTISDRFRSAVSQMVSAAL